MTVPKDPIKYRQHIMNLSKSHMGKPSGRKGKKASDNTRKKLSESHKGKIHSGTFKIGHVFHPFKIHGMKGKTHSQEARIWAAPSL